MSPARCQPDIPSVQTNVSALTDAPGNEVAKLRLRIGALLLAAGCIKPRSVRHFRPGPLSRGEEAGRTAGSETAFWRTIPPPVQ